MDVEELKKFASGRVWSGAQAKERGLVDALGGINDAIRIAAASAGVEDDYKVRYYPRKVPFFQELMTTLEENSEAKSMKSTLGELYPYYLHIKKLETYQGMQARMPFEMTIH